MDESQRPFQTVHYEGIDPRHKGSADTEVIDVEGRMYSSPAYIDAYASDESSTKPMFYANTVTRWGMGQAISKITGMSSISIPNSWAAVSGNGRITVLRRVHRMARHFCLWRRFRRSTQ